MTLAASQPWVFDSLVKCLESLPNLHTLEIRQMHHPSTISLQSALGGAKLPQIKSLTLPPATYPLLQHCHNVEDVTWVTRYQEQSSHQLFRYLASNRHPKVKRLVIPLVMQGDSSRK